MVAVGRERERDDSSRCGSLLVVAVDRGTESNKTHYDEVAPENLVFLHKWCW